VPLVIGAIITLVLVALLLGGMLVASLIMMTTPAPG
jgi:hypothetical protein